jgi:hypothetical protein
MSADLLLVPICDFNTRHQRAAVRDALTGRPAWFPAAGLVLRGDTLCVLAEGLDATAPLRQVRLPGGKAAWVAAAYPVINPGTAA